MAKQRPLAADGLPEPLPMRPVFRVLPIIMGAFQGFAVLILLQQMGRAVATTTNLILAVILGILFGIALPSVAYLLMARRANRRIAAERERRAHAGEPAPSAGGA